MAQMTALRRRMIDDMTLRNLSPATQQSYVYAVAKFSRFFDQAPVAGRMNPAGTFRADFQTPRVCEPVKVMPVPQSA